jgi:TANFOR domain-containing protein
MKKLLRFFILGAVLLLAAQVLRAQVGVSIRILPPYPNRITDYEARPQQVLITLTNQSAGTQQIQLRASVVGDNGIRLEVGQNYKSPTPITLAPGQVRSLNGADLVTLFDYNKLTYSGITKDQFIRGNGLPEGSYQVCMRAFDYNTGAPISADEPIGCSNRFSITSLEPPLVIKPFENEELKQVAANIFTINWTTPPGAPPSIRYKVRIIEVLGNRNPNDAYLSAVPPYFFEKEVMGNVYVYNPADPQLTPGRKYVLAVQAVDPNGGFTFRNNGISQVVPFGFGIQEVTAKKETEPTDTKQKPKKPATTHSIKGKALWAFKTSEDAYKGANGISSGRGLLGFLGAQNNVGAVVQMPAAFPTGGLTTYGANSGVTAGAANRGAAASIPIRNETVGGLVYAAFNPLTDNPGNVRNAISTDRTLMASVAGNGYVSSVVTTPNLGNSAPLSSYISVTGHQELDFGNDVGVSTPSSTKNPLAGATVKIIGVPLDFPALSNPFNSNVNQQQEKQQQEELSKFGIFMPNAQNTPPTKGTPPTSSVSSPTEGKGSKPASGSGQGNNLQPSGNAGVNNNQRLVNANLKPLGDANLIASGKTDDNGNFDVNFLDPEYTGGKKFKELKIVVSKGGLEQTKVVPISVLNTPDIDLGEFICIANTFRFTPTIELPDIHGTANDNKKVVVKIYREDADAIAYPFLNYDGNLAADKKQKQLINGKLMVLVAADSTQVKSSAQFKLSKLFHGISYTVQISTGINASGKSGLLKVAEIKDLSSTQVVNVKPTYTLVASPPAVVGTVQLSLKTGFASIKGAIVKVEFNEDDVEPQVGIVNLGAAGILAGQQYSNTLVGAAINANSNLQRAAAAVQSNNNVGNTLSLTTNRFYTPQVGSSILGGGQSNTLLQTPSSALNSTVIHSYLGAYSAVTDSAGNFIISNLPKLKEGKSFTVKLVRVPNQFKSLKVEPGNEVVINRVAPGERKEVSFRLKPDLVQVVGRVVAENKTALNNARLNFEGSTDYFNTGETGLFNTTYFAGEHYLVIKKEGYADARVKVVVPEKKQSGGTPQNRATQLPDNIVQGQHLFNTLNVFEDTRANQTLTNTKANTVDLTIQLVNTPTVKNQLSTGATFSPLMFGVASSQSAAKINTSGIKAVAMVVKPTVAPVKAGVGQVVSYSVSSPSSNSSRINDFTSVSALGEMFNGPLVSSNYAVNSLSSLDLGDIGFLKRKVGKIRFKIVDETSNAAIANATIKLFDTTAVTDNKGEWYYEGFGGDVKVTVTPPSNSTYVMVEQSLLINETGDEVARVIKLQKGVNVTGTVTSDGAAIAGATIKVEEKPYLVTTTTATGTYSFYIPKGSFQLKAAKSGYLAKTESITVNQQPLQRDFELGSGGGRNIAKILGFDVELDKMTAEGTGYRISGAFVNLVPISELKAVGSVNLKFSNIKVNFDATGNAVPEGNKVVTDEVSIPFKLMGFLPVSFKMPNGITVEAEGTGGKIVAELSANTSQITASRGWGLQNADVTLMPNNATAFVTAFVSSGTVPATTRFSIRGPQGGWQGNVYGFKLVVQTDASYIDREGLHLVGALHTPDLGVIKASNINIEEFLIGSDLSIKRLNLSQSNLPSIKILDWSANLASLLFNEDGFKIGGNMVIKVPSSGTSNISFSDVRIGKDAFFGGKFEIPENGINIFNIVSLKKGSTPISFGQVPNQNGVYKLGGSGKIRFTKFITSEINIPVFEVHTSGRFLVDAPTNFSADITFAKIKVTGIKFDNTGGSPSIGIQGSLSVDVPMLSLSAADITYKNNNGNVNFSIGKIRASLDIPVIKTEVEVTMNDKGFAGAGKLGIPGTPINAAIDFHYFKENGGIDFGAKFSAGVVIPIGFVTIERVGGGFRYNTGTKDFMIDINGGLSIANLGALVKLDPIGLTVRSGPVIEGYADVVVGTALNLAQARVKLDIPQKTFAVQVDASIEPIKGVAHAKLQGDLIISTKENDAFVFLGAGVDVNLLGLIQSNGEFALGVGVKNPTTRGDRVSYYFRNVDNRYVRDVFSGVCINTTARMGIPENRAIGFDFKIASAKIWYYTESNAKLILNFAESSYLFGLSGKFGGGFEFCIASIACAGFNYRACYEFMGGRNDIDGWFISGKAAGRVSLKVGGCNPGCNDWIIKPWCAGFKVCGEGGAEVSYKQKGGLKLGVFVGGNPLCN